MYRKRQRLVNAAADLGADDDRFGENDEDWLVYLEMSREDNAEDEDEEARMAVLETMLAEHDPMSMYVHHTQPHSCFLALLGGTA